MDIFTIHPTDAPLYYLEAGVVFIIVATIGRYINSLVLGEKEAILLNGPMRLGFDGATGLTVVIMVLLVLAAFNIFWTTTATSIILGVSFVSALMLFRKKAELTSFSFKKCFSYGPLALIGSAILLGGLKTPGFWDDTVYHLPYARSILNNHGIHVEPYLIYPFLPEHIYLVFAWILGLKDEYLVQIVNCVFPLLTISLIYGTILRYTKSILIGYLGVIGFLLSKGVFEMVGYAYVDHALTFFITAALVSLALSSESRSNNNRLILLSAIYAGDAIGTKFFGLMGMAPVFIWLIFESKSIKTITSYLFIVFLVGGFWYLRSYYITGNPIHPVGNSIFGYYMWNADDIRRQFEEQASLGLPKDLLHLSYGLFSKPVQVYFGGIGFLAVFFWKNLTSGLRLFWIFSLIYYILWFYIAQVDRYIWPLLPPVTILSCNVILLLLQRVTPYADKMLLSFGKSLMLVAIITVCLVLIFGRVNKYLELERNGFSSIRETGPYPSYSVMHAANQFRQVYGDNLVSIGLSKGTYFFKGTVIGAPFGPGREVQWFTKTDATQPCALKMPSEIAKGLRAFDARLLAIDIRSLCIGEQTMLSRFDVLYKDNYAIIFGLRD